MKKIDIKNIKKIAVIILFIGIIGGVAIIFMNKFGDNSKVLAVINGEKIRDSEFQEFKNEIMKFQKIDLTKFDEETKKQFESSMLEGLISKKIVEQSVEKANIELSDSEINSKFDEIKNQLGSEEEFQNFLKNQNITEQKLKEQIKESLSQEKYFEQNINLSQVNITDEEIKKAFDEISKGQDIGSFEENKENLKNYLMEQKKQEMIMNFVENLKKSSKIEIL